MYPVYCLGFHFTRFLHNVSVGVQPQCLRGVHSRQALDVVHVLLDGLTYRDLVLRVEAEGRVQHFLTEPHLYNREQFEGQIPKNKKIGTILIRKKKNE